MKRGDHQMWYEHAVSETVGFVIIFGIMLTGIALVTLYGYPAVLDAQQNANIRNMERNLISLQSDVKSLAYKSVPYKETTMQVSGGVFKVENPDPTKYFKITDGNDIDILDLSATGNTFNPGGLTFLSDSGDIFLSLQNGAVVKYQSDGSVMLSEPRWFFDQSTATPTLVITLIQIKSTPALAKSGMSNVQMDIEPLVIDETNNAAIIDISPAVDTVKIIYYDPSNDYYKAWDNFFTSSLQMTENPTKTWQKTGVKRVIIKAWRITVLNI